MVGDGPGASDLYGTIVPKKFRIYERRKALEHKVNYLFWIVFPENVRFIVNETFVFEKFYDFFPILSFWSFAGFGT